MALFLKLKRGILFISRYQIARCKLQVQIPIANSTKNQRHADEWEMRPCPAAEIPKRKRK
jgi:hypothetical protein